MARRFQIRRVPIMQLTESQALSILAALAQKSRFAAFRLVLAAEDRRMAAGDIARALDVPLNTMSTHLARLVAVDLLTSERRGRHILYRVNDEAWRAFLAFLHGLESRAPSSMREAFVES